MKKIKVWSILMLVVLTLPIMVACGNDDSTGTSQKIDDVNVANGKKMVELSLTYGNGNPNVYKIDYDNKGRLSKISQKTETYRYDSSMGEQILEYKYNEIANINYETQVVTIPFGSFSQSFSFSLNENGYMSRIGGCTLTYDESGYLKTVDEGKSIGTIEYDSNDIIKATVQKFSGGAAFYYVPFANFDTAGNLYIRVQHSDEDEYRRHSIDEKDICVFIAYQAGLLGQVTKTVLKFKEPSEAEAIFEYDAKGASNGTITVVYDDNNNQKNNQILLDNVIRITDEYIKIQIIGAGNLLKSDDVNEIGVIYSTSKEAILSKDQTQMTSVLLKEEDENTIKIDLFSLQKATKYYYCLFIKNGDTYKYGEVNSFTTPQEFNKTTLSGQWQGNWGMYYEVEDPWGNIVAFDSYDTDIVFYPDYDYATHGYGYQVDWYNEGPYERISYRFHWSVTNGVIHLTYPGYPEYNSDIRDYHLNNDHFRGYFTNSTQPFELYKIADYYNWSYYYEWDHHYWPYDSWSWDVYYNEKTRSEMDTRITQPNKNTTNKNDVKPNIIKMNNRSVE